MSHKMTGILGGTFNPIHNQHLLLAKSAYEQLDLSKVLIIPSGISYLKEGTNVLPAKIRYEMCLLAVQDIPYLEVSDIEIRRKGNSYTCDTIRELTESDPSAGYCFIIGADTLFMLEKWKNPEYIFANCCIAVAQRLDEDRYSDDKINCQIKDYEIRYGAQIRKINIEISDLSSSLIRKAAERGDDIRSYVPEKVAAYINEHGLYR